MRRVFNFAGKILAWTPALLLAVWILSLFFSFGFAAPHLSENQRLVTVLAMRGSLVLHAGNSHSVGWGWVAGKFSYEEQMAWAGQATYIRFDNIPIYDTVMTVPIAFLISLTLPFAVMANQGLRLWMLFAWIALIGAECAFYLR